MLISQRYIDGTQQRLSCIPCCTEITMKHLPLYLAYNRITNTVSFSK